jgi:carbamoyl-phosphate synthase large subunit
MRGVPPTAFVVSEYLPGRDFGCQSLWKDGRLVLVKTYERLSYLGTGSQPAQVSSVAALAKTVVEPRVVETCAAAIRALDPRASGVFSADLKEDAGGAPCLTEINAGRFSSATNIFDLVPEHNMATTWVALALGAAVELCETYDVAPDWYMLRDIDTPPLIFHARQFFEGVDAGLDSRRGRGDRNRNRAQEAGRWPIYRSANGSAAAGHSSASPRLPRAARPRRSSRRSAPR